MGTFKEKYLIISVYDWTKEKKVEEDIDNYILKIGKEYRGLFGKFHSVTNGFLTYFMSWDGSKEGWDTQIKASKIREAFIDFVKKVASAGQIIYLSEDLSDNRDNKFITSVESFDKENVSG